MTELEARQVLKLVLAGFPTQRQRMTREDLEQMVMVWESGLADLEFERVRAAAIRMMRTLKFLPAVAELRAAVVAVEQGRAKTGVEAWGTVVRAQRIEGSWKAPGVDFFFSDPITARVVESIGWTNICSSQNPVADRAHFIAAYDRITADMRIEAMAADGATAPMLAAGAAKIRAQLEEARERYEPEPDPDADPDSIHSQEIH